MVNLFEIMRSAQGGEALANMSRHFGLGPADTQRALEALLPAFSLAFQRNVHDPNAFARFLELLGSGRYASFYDASPAQDPAAASANWASGAEVLNRIMGSKDVSRKVAEQAALSTGIGVDILQQMLPLIAATIMGGAFRFMSLQGMGDLFARWAAAFHQAHAAQHGVPKAPAPPSNNPFEMWAAMLAPMSAAKPAAAPQPGTTRTGQAEAANLANPIEAWSAMVDAMLGRQAPPPPPPAPEPPPGNPLQLLSQIFEAGTAMQAQYVGTLKTIMDQFWTAGGVDGSGRAAGHPA